MEIKAVGKGKITTALYIESDIPFLVWVFDNMNFDVNANIHKLKDPEEYLNSVGNICNLFLIDRVTYQLEGMRMLGLHQTIVAEFRAALRRQLTTYPDYNAVDAAANNILRRTPIEVMLRKARHSHTYG